MGYKLLDNVAIAEVAFEATSKTIEGLFSSSAEALTSVMIEKIGIKPKIKKSISLNAKTVDYLLFDFLNKLVFYKDAEGLLFGKFEVRVKKDSAWHLRCKAYGDYIANYANAMLTDVKGVTMHMFRVSKTKSGWEAAFVLDI